MFGSMLQAGKPGDGHVGLICVEGSSLNVPKVKAKGGFDSEFSNEFVAC